MVFPNISASDPQEEQISTIRSQELAEQQALEAEQEDVTRRELTAEEAAAIRQQQVEEQIASGIEDPVAEQRLLEQQRQQAEAESAARKAAAEPVSDAQAAERRRLTEIALRDLARGGATDAEAGIIRITRSEFERRKNSPILAEEIERAKRENRRTQPSALGVNVRNVDFDERKERFEQLAKSDDPRVREAAKIGIDLEDLREKGQINTEEVNKLAEVQGAIDFAEGSEKRTRQQLARVALDTAGDIGLSMIPVYGTARDARRVANNWDQASNSERALDTGLLAVSAVGDVLTVFGVGVFLKSAATGARTATTSTKVITAAADNADELSDIVRAAKATQRTVSRLEVTAVPDAKLADEAGKLAKAFPKKTLDVVIEEPSTVAIKSAGRIDDVVRAAKDTPNRSRFVLELDRPNMNVREINKIATQLGDVAAGKPVPLAKGGTMLPTKDATVLIRRINRGSSKEAIQAQAVEGARLAKLIGDDRSFTTIRKKILKDLTKKAREAGERDIKEASENLARQLRTRGVKVEFEDIDFDSAKQVTVKLDKALSNKEITKLAQELEQQAGRIPTPLAKGGKQYPSKGREIVIDQIARGKDVNRTRNKLIELLNRKKLKVSRQKEERVVRLAPDDTPTGGALSGRKGDTGRGGGLAVLEKPKTRISGGGVRVGQTTRRTTRAVSGRGKPRRFPFSVPVPRRGGKPGDEPGRGREKEPEPDETPEDVPEPDAINDPAVTADPDPDPVPDFVPEPEPTPDDEPVDDNKKTITGTDGGPRRKGKPDGDRAIVKAAPDLLDKDGNQLYPVVFNWRQGQFFKQRDIRTGKTRTFKRVPQGGIESGKTPQETLKAVGFDASKPKKSRFPISSKVAALIDNRRISFTGSRSKLGE